MTAEERVREYLNAELGDAWAQRQRRIDEIRTAIAEAEQALQDGKTRVGQMRLRLTEMEADAAEIKRRIDALAAEVA